MIGFLDKLFLNIFILVCVLILRKNCMVFDILFVDVSWEFEKLKK